jgi:hypothetical protein
MFVNGIDTEAKRESDVPTLLSLDQRTEVEGWR